jgi:serine/threonine-protein kinase
MAMVLETHRVEALVQTPVDERNGAVSPDGRWLLYESKSSGRFEIYVKPYPDVNSGIWTVSTSGGIRPTWAPNGQELFYMAPDDSIMSVSVQPRGGAWNSSDPVKVFTGAYETGGALSGRNYDVSPDGKRFLMIKQAPADPASAPRIEIVQHWADELKRLVPEN